MESVTHLPSGSAEPFVDGWTAPGFDGVRAAFETNLHLGEDLGAAVCIYRHGRCVVDLWGGRRLDGGPYPREALHLVYSTTKGLAALCLALAVEEGAVELDAPVARYWPQFAAHGKAGITVRQLASHQAGLPGFQRSMPLEGLGDWDGCVDALAGQTPEWSPGRSHGYHAVTLGYLVGEVIRRATGRSVGRLFRERLGGPLSLDAWIGLPSTAHSRVELLFEAAPDAGIGAALREREATAGTLTNQAFTNPTIGVESFNNPITFTPEIPAVNGISDARSLARAYAAVVDGPLRIIGEKVVDEMRAIQVDGPDLVLVDQPTRFGIGFLLASPREPMLGTGSFGHNGRGGSLAFAHPESGVSFGFVANRMVLDPGPDRRSTRLIAALREALRS